MDRRFLPVRGLFTSLECALPGTLCLATLNQGAFAQSIADRPVQCFGAIDDEQQRALRGPSALNQVGPAIPWRLPRSRSLLRAVPPCQSARSRRPLLGLKPFFF